MACREFEDLILDYCEDAASPADRALLEAHVAGCLGCREFLVEQQQLHARLSQSLRAVSLSPAFQPGLSRRIAEQRPAPRFRRLPRVLDSVGYLSLALAAGCLIQQLPHAAMWVGMAALAGSAGFGVWESAKALRGNFGHR